MSDYSNCFAFQELRGIYSCKALNKMDCANCSFYKTKEQYKAELIKEEDEYYKI